LPFLRFARDKRGYETTALVHAFRGRHGRTRQKLLYWFRTPPSVKVGRPALDEEAIRWIEEHNPDIDFDWPKILESTPPASPPEDDGKGRRLRREKTDRRGRGGERPAQPRQTQPPAPAARPEPLDQDPEYAGGDKKAPDEEAPDEVGPGDEAAPGDEVVAVAEEDGAAAGEEEEAAAGDDAMPEPEAEALAQLTHPDLEEVPAAARAPVESLVAREQLIRLRARYAELQTRITELGGDPARAEELRTRAEPLNPDLWVTSGEAKIGLEEFERRIGDLRATLGLRRRRRSRRGGRRRRSKPAEQASQAASDNRSADSHHTPAARHAPDEPPKDSEPG
jgi:hypothetical protein